jgi:uncharacterized protein
MIIDFHAHLWSRDDAEEVIARECQRHGVDKACISALESPIPDLDEVKALNDRVYKAAREYPGFYLPFAYVNPLHGRAAMDELNRGVDEGAVGLKLWISCYANHPSVFPVVERALELDWPVLQHAWHKAIGQYEGESDPVHVAELSRRYPELKLVMAHFGGDGRYGLRAVRDCPGVIGDTSGSMTDNGLVETWVRECGAERLIWGTDMPGADLLLTLSKVRDADLTEAEKALVLGGNAARLLGLEG